MAPATVITKTCGVTTTSASVRRTSTVTGVVDTGITRGRVISARIHPRPGDDVVDHSVQGLPGQSDRSAGHGHRGPLIHG